MMGNHKQVIRKIRHAVETTLQQGGITLTPDLKEYRGSGYAVGTQGIVVYANRAVGEMYSFMNEVEGPYYGMFKEDEDTISIDRVEVVDTLEQAIDLAQQWRQRSVYQFDTNWVIAVPQVRDEEGGD